MSRKVLLILSIPLVLGLLIGLFLVLTGSKSAPLNVQSIENLFGLDESVIQKSPSTTSSFELSFLQRTEPKALVVFEGRDAATKITASGATSGNTESDTRCSLENQRIAYYTVAAGVILNDAKLLDTGLRAYEWGYGKQASNGSFPCERKGDSKPIKYEHVHPLSFFIESSARSVLLIRESNVDESFKKRAEALVPKIYLAGKAFNNPKNLDDFFTNGKDTNMLTTAALAIHQAGVLGNDAKLQSVAKGLFERILARQTTDGTFPEKKGFDSSYQTVSLEYLIRYASMLPEGDWKNTVSKGITKGIEKELTVIRADGTIDTSSNTRTGACGPAVSGSTPKGRNYDVTALRLYYYGHFANAYDSYAPIAAKVQYVGQGFDHKGDYKEDEESPN